jgi:hypothetical protein
VDVECEERELALERVQELAKHIQERVVEAQEQAVRVWVELARLVVVYLLERRWVLGELW